MADSKPKKSAGQRSSVMSLSKPRPPTANEKLEAYGRWPVLTFLLCLVLPVGLTFAAMAVLVYVQMTGVARDMDRHEDSRTTISIHGALDGFLNTILQATIDEGTWDEAFLNVVVNNDSGWMDTTWGESARMAQSYDTVIVTDQTGQIVFGESGEGTLQGNIEQRFPAAATMLHQLNGAIEGTGDASTVSSFAEDKKGVAAVAAISIHRSSDAPPVAPEKRRILWIAQHLSTDVLRQFAQRYQSPLAHLTQSPGSRESSVIIEDANNQPITRVAWVPERPGEEALGRALLNVNIAMAVIGAVAALTLVIIGALTVRKSNKVERRFTEVVEVVEQKTAEINQVLEKEAKAAAAAALAKENRAEGVFANNFDIAYAPIFDLREQRMVGAEALLRWKGQDGAPLYQEDLTALELNTLLQRLGILGLRRVLEETAKLPDLPIIVAVPPQILGNGLFVEKMGGTLAVTHFPPERLLLAVDVSASPPLAPMQPQIDDLKLRRIGLVLDQFMLGPGTLPFTQAGLANRIRLSREIVGGAADDPARAALTDATFTYAAGAGLTIGASHVTSREDATRLLRLGCREFSGTAIAEPMPIGHLTQLAFMPMKRKAG